MGVDLLARPPEVPQGAGTPLPPGLTPAACAQESDRGGALAVSIEVRCWPFGLLVAYAGDLQIGQEVPAVR